MNAFLTAAVGAFLPGTADAANAFRFHLTPVGDFTYTTASGNSYARPATAVPEPHSLFLLGIGTVLALLSVRPRVASR